MRETKNRKETVKRNSRKKEACKVIVAGILAVGIFGGGFVVLNHLVFAAEHNTPVILQSTIPEVKVDDVLPSSNEKISYEKAAYKVETDYENTVSNPNAISAEEAADIGAQYVWDVYGIDLKDYTISMSYAKDPSRAIGYWYGDVYKTGDSNKDSLYRFGIEAVSGERDSIQRIDRSDVGRETTPYQRNKAQEYYGKNCSKYLEKAKIYAEKQLLSAPLKAEFIGVSAMIAPGYEYEVPEGAATTMIAEDGHNQDVIKVPWGEEIPATYIYVSVLVTDAAGKQVNLDIDVSDQSLSYMLNCYNGVDYDSDSIG